MPSNLYASLESFCDRLCIPTDDDRTAALTEILEGASRWGDEQTGHQFFTPSVDETRYYSVTIPRDSHWESLDAQERPWPGRAPTRLDIDEWVTVTSVATDEDGDGVYERTWTPTTDYWLGPRNAPNVREPYRYLNRNVATGRYYFPYWEESVAITGRPGYCTLINRPPSIRELTLMVAEIMARPVIDMSLVGVQSYKIGSDLNITMKPEDLPPAGQRILDAYVGLPI